MRRIFALLAAASATLLLTGCGGSGNGILNIPNPRVRFVNAFPDVATAKAQVGSDVVTSGVALGSVSDYIVTDNGNKNFTAGQSTFSDLATLANELYETQKRYTGIGWGQTTRAILLLEEDKSQATNNTISLRTVNVGEGLGAVDVYVQDSTGSGTLPVSPSFANVAEGATSTRADVSSPGAFSARVRVYAAGQTTTALLDNTVLLDSRERASLVVIKDPNATGGLRLLVLREDI